MIVDALAGIMRILGREVVAEGERLHDRHVRAEVAPLVMRDLNPSIRHIERRKSHPAHEQEENSREHPVPWLKFGLTEAEIAADLLLVLWRGLSQPENDADRRDEIDEIAPEHRRRKPAEQPRAGICPPAADQQS